jgi:putative lipase involved disintegration of autophagic bodies
MKVYLATSGEYSDYGVRRVFARYEDAEAYELADNVEEYELTEGPMEVRTWHHLLWWPDLPDREQTSSAAANPSFSTERRDFDGHPDNVVHQWHIGPHHLPARLGISGWDLDRIRKVYSEQRAQYIARQDLTGDAP